MGNPHKGRARRRLNAGLATQHTNTPTTERSESTNNNSVNSPHPAAEGEGEYVYVDEAGEPLFQVRRHTTPTGGKTFSQHRWTDEGWDTRLADARRVLYRLPQVIAALERGEPVYIAEGEKDVQALEAAGVVATCNPGGAGKWHDDYLNGLPVKGMRFFVVWDKDGEPHYAGERHGLTVRSSLLDAGAERVTMLRARAGKDAADHLAAGHSINEFYRKRPRLPDEPRTRSPSTEQTSDIFWKVYAQLWEYARAHNLKSPSTPTPNAEGIATFEACCPAHDDRNPSLSVAIGQDKPVVLHCHAAQCAPAQIAEKLGMSLAELSRPISTDDFETDVQKRMHRIRVGDEAKRRIVAEAAGDGYALPEVGRTLVDDLAVPPRERKYTIDRLHTVGGNSLLVAQYKTGKTTLLLNLVQSLADREPFLGHFEVASLDGRVAFWNYELDADMFRNWARDIEMAHPERIAEPFHLRGASLPVWLAPVAEEVVEWLQANEVQFLIIDPAAQAWNGLVESENDNTNVGAFLHVLDHIKKQAGVSDLVLATHMGRAAVDEDSERSRGATRLEDWMDAGWYLTKDKKSDARALRARGRDVEVEAIELNYDHCTRRLTFSGQTRDERREQDGTQAVVDALAALQRQGAYPATTNDLTKAMAGNKTHHSKWVQAAEKQGLIVRKRDGQALLCELTDEGQRRIERRVSPPRKCVRRRKR